MKLFRPRRRHDAQTAARSPLDQVVTLYKAGHYAAAESTARAVAESRSWARDDQYALLAWSLVAVATGAQGRHADAVALFDGLLPDFARVFGAEGARTLKLRSDRAQELTRLGRHAECEAECAAVARSAGRGSAPQMALVVFAARNGLVFALNAQGRYQEAEATAREALAAQPAQGRITLPLRLGLARSLNGQARHEEALAEAQAADELRLTRPDDFRPETGAVELVRATALLGLGRTAEARPPAVAAHEACLAAFGPDHGRTVEARKLLDRMEAA
jgi:tetratricopeptide (TPR) repeat protein